MEHRGGEVQADVVVPCRQVRQIETGADAADQHPHRRPVLSHAALPARARRVAAAIAAS